MRYKSRYYMDRLPDVLRKALTLADLYAHTINSEITVISPESFPTLTNCAPSQFEPVSFMVPEGQLSLIFNTLQMALGPNWEIVQERFHIRLKYDPDNAPSRR